MSEPSPEGGGIDSAVYAFLVDEVDSVPELEALLLTWESRPKQWSADEVAHRLYVDSATARDILRTLAQRNLITSAPGRPDVYSYHSRSLAADQLIEAVASTYRKQLVRVTTIIHTKPSQAVREFARAFKFKKEGS